MSENGEQQNPLIETDLFEGEYGVPDFEDEWETGESIKTPDELKDLKNDETIGSRPYLDPLAAGEPVDFDGRESKEKDPEEEDFEAVFYDSQTPTEEEEAAMGKEAAELEETPSVLTEEKEVPSSITDVNPPASSNAGTPPTTVVPTEVANPTKSDEPEQPPTPPSDKTTTAEEKPQKKQLLCPHCHQPLYRRRIGDRQFFVHKPEDALKCQSSYESIEAVEKEQESLLATQKMITKLFEEEKQKKENAQKAKEAQVSLANIEGLDKLNDFMTHQTDFNQTLEECLKTIQQQLETLNSAHSSLQEDVASLQNSMSSNDISDSVEQLSEVSEKLSAATGKLNTPSNISSDLIQVKNDLEEATDEMKSVTKYAESTFLLYINSVRAFNGTNVKLKNMIALLRTFFEEAEERYKNSLDKYDEVSQKALTEYNRKSTELGQKFEERTQNFFKEADNKILNQLSNSRASASGKSTWVQFKNHIIVAFFSGAGLTYIIDKFMK